MNKMMLAFGATGVAALLAGCNPELAQVQVGAEEARWQETLRQNYSGYEAPRTAPPAIRDNVSPRLLEEEERKREAQDSSAEGPAPASDDAPALVVDKVADQLPMEDVSAAKPEDKSADKSADKPADKPAEKPADKAADKPAAGGEEYVVKPGDNLGKIAKKFYGDARRCDVIVEANPSLKANPDRIRAGMKLVIPKI